jgi:AbrB family looped-hinge helix DNA binding protein
MSLVSVKNKFQVVIPQKVREKIGIQVGDLLEARVERGKITFTPKSVLDRAVAESFEDFKAGRSYGPFRTHEDLMASLRAESAKLNAGKIKKSSSRK